MENKEMRLSLPSDILLAEIIITRRAGFGMKPAVHKIQTGFLTIPDDFKKDKTAEKEAKAKAKAEAKAEAEKAEAEAKAKAEKAEANELKEIEEPK